MSVFTEECFFFLRNPHGGVDNLQAIKAAGFGGVFCNIKDYPVEAWEEYVRPRALNAGMFCGPWARTEQGHGFDPSILDRLVYCADDWGSPLIVNTESELNVPESAEIIQEILATVGKREWALSMEPTPFANVDWRPLADVPVLPQCFIAGYTDGAAVADTWHRVGIKCCFPTWATYGGMTPGAYDLKAPYSLYTADDCGGNFKAWTPTSTGFVGCEQSGYIPPDGGDMQKIGSQHGVTAAVNRLRTLDPKGTLLVPDEKGKWPSISTLEQAVPVDQWKAYDKLERSLTILVQDHDEAVDGPF